jgi:hypothetical protein
MAASTIVEYPIFMGNDPKLAEHLKRETLRLGLVKIDAPSQPQESILVHHLKKFTFNFIQSLVQDSSSSTSINDASSAPTPTKVHEGNFKAIVEQLHQQNIKKKLALDPNANLTFMTVVIRNPREDAKPDVDWFVKHGYIAKELWPHVVNVASGEGKKPGLYPTLKEIVTIGRFRASHLANRLFMDSPFFLHFIKYYRITHTMLYNNLKVKKLKKLTNLGFSLEELKAMGITHSVLVETWDMDEEDENLFQFDAETWKTLGKPEKNKDEEERRSTKSQPYSFEIDEEE